MNRSEVTKLLARKNSMSQERVDNVLTSFFELVATCIKNEEDVNLRGFGKFESRQRKATRRRHPSTGEEIEVPEKTAILFSPSTLLKEKLNA